MAARQVHNASLFTLAAVPVPPKHHHGTPSPVVAAAAAAVVLRVAVAVGIAVSARPAQAIYVVTDSKKGTSELRGIADQGNPKPTNPKKPTT